MNPVRKHRRAPRRAVIATVAALLPLALLLAGGSRASAEDEPIETTGSYTSTYAGQTPKIYYPRMLQSGPTFTAPAETPAATITTVSVDLGFTLVPSGMYYQAYLCADAANTQCADVSPTGVFQYNSGWAKNNLTAFAGYPATTTFHFVIRIQDGQTGTIIPALNPYRYSKRQNATVNYVY